MNGGLLWVNKDSSSTHLSRSSKAETARIRAHVQHLSIQSRTRRKSAPPLRNQRKTSKAHVLDRRPSEALVVLKQEDEQSKDEKQQSSPPEKPADIRILSDTLTWLPAATDQEKRSFLFFLKRTAQEWSGYRDVSFWNMLVPQASAAHKAIFHSVAALGALHESLESNQDSLRESHLQQLLWQQCSKAAHAANSGQITHTVALMSCIILVCLQNLQSNPVAFQMLRAGSNLVNDLEAKIADGTLKLTQSEQTLLDDYLKPILERLGTRYCFIVDLPSAFALHVASKQVEALSRTETPDLPKHFLSLLEARNSLEALASWCIINTTSNDPQNGVFCAQKSLVMSLIAKWHELLEKIDAAVYKEHPNLVVSKSLLKAAGMVTTILFDTLGSTEECIYDKHLDKFREIVEIYDRVSQASRMKRRQKVSFGIDTGIVHTLAFVIGRCRDPKVRRDALGLMQRDDHVEGDMRSSTGMNVLNRLVLVEEAGRTITCQEDIVEQDRVRIWQDDQFWHSGFVRIYFIRYPYDPLKGAKFQEEWARMPVRIVEDSDQPSSPAAQRSQNLELPNVVFGRGMAAFLDESTGTYHRVTISSFFLPMPRM